MSVGRADQNTEPKSQKAFNGHKILVFLIFPESPYAKETSGRKTRPDA
jgi:hypothetical protein